MAKDNGASCKAQRRTEVSFLYRRRSLYHNVQMDFRSVRANKILLSYLSFFSLVFNVARQLSRAEPPASRRA